MANLDRDHYLDKQGLQTLINDLETSIVAEEYSSSTTYALGSYCIYNNLLYRCTTAITTAEAWNSNHWTQIILADDVERKASTVTELADVLLNNPTDNDLLVYDSNLSGGKTWKNTKKIVTCTKAQFDAWSANNSFPYTDCKYIVTDVNNLNTTSADIPYDSTGTASVKDKLDDLVSYIKIKYFEILATDVTRNMDISSHVTLDSGYKFLCYLANVVPSGFTTDQYIWVAEAHTIQGRPWWNTNPIAGANTSGRLRFYYLEVKDIT